MTQPLTPTVSDRLLTAVRSIIRAQFPQFDYAGTFEYSVQAATSSSVDCSPTDTTLPLPSLVGIPMRSGLLGESVTLTVGNRCLVQFVNRDPSRPIIVGGDPIPVTSTVDATETLDLGPSSTAVNIAGGAHALVPSAWATGLANVLTPFFNGLTTATLSAQAATALTAMGALPPDATTKTKAT